eukprot:2265136-Pleurochrysis_carterae.AAC.1
MRVGEIGQRKAVPQCARGMSRSDISVSWTRREKKGEGRKGEGKGEDRYAKADTSRYMPPKKAMHSRGKPRAASREIIDHHGYPSSQPEQTTVTLTDAVAGTGRNALPLSRSHNQTMHSGAA